VLDGSGFEFQQRQEIYLFSITYRPDFGLSSLLFIGYQVFFPGDKAAGMLCSSPSGVLVKKEWSFSLFMPSWRGHGQLYLLLAVSKNVSHIFKLIEYVMEK
jgi:hypothetical protein